MVLKCSDYLFYFNFTVCVCLVVCDRSDDCNVAKLKELEGERYFLHNFIELAAGKYLAEDEGLTLSCR